MRGIFAFVLSALIAVPVFAQSSASLKAANQARSSAMAAGNSKGWARYTTDDFTLTDATGKVKTKQDRVAEIEGHAATGQRTPPTDEKWRSYGPSTAVYTARITGADSTPQRITTTWVKQGRTWKVAAVQLTNVAAAPSP
jgi:ketosteroid isomerase-like protein